MKASILALSISTLLSASAFASATKVNLDAANSATDQLITSQMQAIDASVQHQLATKYANAQPGDIAIIDNDVYEQQPNGTWAAVGTASAALVAGMLSGSSNSSSDEFSPELPIYEEPTGNSPEFGGDRPELEQPTKPGYNGVEFDRVSDSVINVTKNGIPMGSLFMTEGEWYYGAVGGAEPIHITKDLINGKPPIEVDPTKPGYNGVEFDRVSDSVINVTKNGIPMGSLFMTEGEWYYGAVGGAEPIHITKDLINGKPPIEVDPTKPGYNGVEFDRVSDSVINVTKNGIPMGSLFMTEGEWYYGAVGGAEPIHITKDLINGKPPIEVDPTKPGYNGVEFDRVSDSAINVTKNGIPMGSLFMTEGEWYYSAVGGAEPIHITKDLINGKPPIEVDPTKPGYNGVEFDRVSDSVINVTKNGIPMGSLFMTEGEWYYGAVGGAEPIHITKDLINGKPPIEVDPTKPGYNGVEFDRVSDSVINVTKNGIPMGSLFMTEGEWYYGAVGGAEPIHITKDLINGKPPIEVDPTKPGYNGVEFDRVSDSVINVTKNGIPMGSLFMTEGEWYYGAVGGAEPIHITKDLINGKPPIEVDPTKPGYNGVEFDRVSDSVINVTKNGIPMGSLFMTEGEWYYGAVGGAEPIHITKDLINGKPPIEVDPTKPGYNGVEFDRVSDSVINVTKNGIPMGSLFMTEGEWYYGAVGGAEPIHITKDLINGKPPIEVDPTKPGYEGITVEERGGVYYIDKNGQNMGALFNNGTDLIWNPASGDSVVVSKDMVNSKLKNVNQAKLKQFKSKVQHRLTKLKK
ncbi:hypothetical protein [Vibrio gallicus]|uniref:hypothetical protein n=1 Tax=Vibrio gallicus TaxID=190897 RepID=UPI0021C3FC0E|nr:hypothetical protein [Vibrio gallicus]